MAGEDRPAALEFSELGSAGPAGFEVRGSGTATVTTAPLYQPGARYVVETRDGEHATRTVQRADEAGRLHVTVELGPGNPYQQYSPPARADARRRHRLGTGHRGRGRPALAGVHGAGARRFRPRWRPRELMA